MALQISKTLDNLVIAPECYVKIISVSYETPMSYDAEPGIQLNVGFYFNEAARDADERAVIQYRNYTITDKTQETREQQYAYLKTLDYFEGAIDV